MSSSMSLMTKRDPEFHFSHVSLRRRWDSQVVMARDSQEWWPGAQT